MADTQSGEKSHEPTPKRLRDAKQRGDILQSKELAVGLVVGCGVAALVMVGPWAMESLRIMLADALMLDAGDVRDFAPGTAIMRHLLPILLPFGAIFAIAALATIAAPALLGTIGFRSEAIAFKGDRINPLAGVKRMFSSTALVELGKVLLKTVLLGAIGIWLIWQSAGRLAADYGLDVALHLQAMGGRFMLMIVAMAAALALVGFVDAPLQYWKRIARLRMTRQDVVDEQKSSEGSPEVKGAIRRRRHEILSRSARAAVPTATVVLTNPSHFAVALKYEPGVDAAPVIVARGRDSGAFAIRQLAEANGVTIVDHPPLTRAIYFTGRTGQVVRDDLFMAVAVVLAFVFQIDRRLAAADLVAMAKVPDGARFDAEGRHEA